MVEDFEKQLKNLNYPWDWKVRHEAVRRLEVIGDPAAAPELARLVTEDKSPFVRAAAARALGKLGSPEGVPALTRALEDPAFHVRQAAIWSLGEIGAAAAPALPALRPLTQNPQRYPQAELTVAQIAEIAIGRIEAALEEAKAPPQEATAPAGGEGVLSPEERKAKREAALARKRAREAGLEAPEPAGMDTGGPEPVEAAPASGPERRRLSPEEIRIKRQGALARKRQLDALRARQQAG